MFRTIGDLEGLTVSATAPMRAAMAMIDAAALGIVLVVDDDGALISTVTDGDIRRALLGGVDLGDPVRRVLAIKGERPSITGPEGAGADEIIGLLDHHRIRHLPLTDGSGRPVGLAVTDAPARPAPAVRPRALIMAGGFGRRLGELTRGTPKPMLPIRGRPMMAWVVDQIAAAGIEDVTVSLHYLGGQIQNHFGDGAGQGVRIRYVEESAPRGTAGAVSMIIPSDQPLVVLNADVMCATDLRTLVQFHADKSAAMTLAVRRHLLHVPFGVVDCEELHVRRITEKPSLPFLINAGMYVLGAEACAAVPGEGRFEMTDLAQVLLNAGRSVAAYPISDDWLDVGRPEDYQQAQSSKAG